MNKPLGSISTVLSIVLLVVGALAAGVAGGYWLMPVKITEKERIVRIEVEKRDVETRSVETRRPDGSSVIETVTTDRTTVNTDETKDKSKVTEKSKSNWLVTVAVEPKVPFTFDNGLVLVHRRILGEIYLGAGVYADLNEGASTLVALTIRF